MLNENLGGGSSRRRQQQRDQGLAGLKRFVTNNWAGARVGQRPGNLVFTWLIMPGTSTDPTYIENRFPPDFNCVCVQHAREHANEHAVFQLSIEKNVYLLYSMRCLLFKSRRIFFLSFSTMIIYLYIYIMYYIFIIYLYYMLYIYYIFIIYIIIYFIYYIYIIILLYYYHSFLKL